MFLPERDCSSCKSLIWTSSMIPFSRRKERSISGFMAFVLFLVSHGRRDDFVGRGHAGQNLADAVFTQGAHPQVARPLPDCAHAQPFIDHAADFVVQHADFKNSHAAFISGATAFVATTAL